MMHGPGAGQQLDNAYSDFLSELGVDKSMARGGAPGGSGVHGARSGLGFSSSSGGSNDAAKLYVGHLPSTMNAERMLEMFKPFGRVLQIDVIPDRERQLSCKGFAFVLFSTPEEAIAAKALNGHVVEGKSIDVQLKAEPRAPREPVNACRARQRRCETLRGVHARPLQGGGTQDAVATVRTALRRQGHHGQGDGAVARVRVRADDGRAAGHGRHPGSQRPNAGRQNARGSNRGAKPPHNQMNHQMNPYAAHKPVRPRTCGVRSVRGRWYEQACRGPAVAAQYAAYYGYASARDGSEPQPRLRRLRATRRPTRRRGRRITRRTGTRCPARRRRRPRAPRPGAGDRTERRGGGGAAGASRCRRRRRSGVRREGAFAVGDPAEAPPPPPPGSVVAVPSPPPLGGAAPPPRRGERHGDVERTHSIWKHRLPLLFALSPCLPVCSKVVLEARNGSATYRSASQHSAAALETHRRLLPFPFVGSRAPQPYE